jgi:hypothetical protein
MAFGDNMNRDDFIEEADHVFGICINLLKDKSADYSKEKNAFEVFTTAEENDIITAERAMLFECHKKIVRIKNLLDKPPRVKDENIYQSIQDAINSLVFLHVYWEETHK